MLESIIVFLAIAFVVVAVVGVAGYFALRWIFLRSADRMASVVDRSIGGVAARAFTRLARIAAARGIGLDEAQRIFGFQIDRLAKIMASRRCSRFFISGSGEWRRGIIYRFYAPLQPGSRPVRVRHKRPFRRRQAGLACLVLGALAHHPAAEDQNHRCGDKDG